MKQTREERLAKRRAYRIAHRERINAKAKEHRVKHREEIRAKVKEHRVKHREELLTKARVYRDNHREEVTAKAKEYHLAHKEELSAKAKEQRIIHGEEMRAKSRERYVVNREVALIRAKKYRDNNKEKVSLAFKKWYKTHPRIEEHKNWSASNKDKIKGYGKTYYAKNKEKRITYFNNYKKCYPDKVKNTILKRTYGITVDQYNQMFTSQNGNCDICGKNQAEFKRALGVDHNHTTDQVRGLLCIHCNFVLGFAKESAINLKAGVNYLHNIQDTEDNDEPLRCATPNDTTKNNYLKRNYNITLEKHSDILLNQRNQCAICNDLFTPEIVPFVDHNHTTGQVRGLLCIHCNSMIGYANDDPAVLNNAITYLNKYS